jgi:tetratricopeptide (TPR) repeat protein/TolB-like protein
VLLSSDFDASRRSRDFLCFIVDETLAGRGEALSQTAIAIRVFERKDDFDPLLDPIVRIQAGRLRRSLERYYLLAGKEDSLRIDLPKGSYVPVFRKVSTRARPSEAAPEAAEAAPPPAADSWPTVQLTRFEGDPADGELPAVADRLAEELATELGRYRDARLVLQREAELPPSSRRVEARFDLGGRIRRENEGFVVTARLLDRMSGEQVWSDDYPTTPRRGRWCGPPAEIARVIAARVGSEQGVLVQALAGEFRKLPAATAGAYGAILRSYQFFFARNLDGLAPAILSLRRVVAEEPETALAWTQLARLYIVNCAFELTDMDTPLDEAIRFANQAVRLDPSSARVRCMLASALLVKGEVAAAREELEQALRLNPGSLVYLEIIGWLLALSGDWERGIAIVKSAMERNPHHLPHVYHGLWADNLRRGQLEEAYKAALDYRDATFFWRSLMRASCLGHLGRTKEARVEVAELLRQKPDFPARARVLIGRYIKPEELRERVVEGLRKAGLPLP